MWWVTTLTTSGPETWSISANHGMLKKPPGVNSFGLSCALKPLYILWIIFFNLIKSIAYRVAFTFAETPSPQSSFPTIVAKFKIKAAPIVNFTEELYYTDRVLTSLCFFWVSNLVKCCWIEHYIWEDKDCFSRPKHANLHTKFPRLNFVALRNSIFDEVACIGSVPRTDIFCAVNGPFPPIKCI